MDLFGRKRIAQLESALKFSQEIGERENRAIVESNAQATFEQKRALAYAGVIRDLRAEIQVLKDELTSWRAHLGKSESTGTPCPETIIPRCAICGYAEASINHKDGWENTHEFKPS
jgi:hypothetical protein